MSRIIRDQAAGSAFADTLQGAGAVRESLLRTKPTALSNRDRRREEARLEGYDVGFAEGFAQGIGEGRKSAFDQAKRELDEANAAQIEQFAQALTGVMQGFERERAKWFKHSEQRLADLAIEIARRAVIRELQLGRECVVEIAQHVLAEVTEATNVRLRVNPVDESALEARKSELESAFSHFGSIEVVADRQVGAGCRIEYDAGTIDARVEDYLARIVKQTREAV